LSPEARFGSSSDAGRGDGAGEHPYEETKGRFNRTRERLFVRHTMTEDYPRTRRFSRLPYLLAIIAASMVVLAAWVLRDRFTPLVPGVRAPAFVIPDLDGKPVSLADHRGEVVLVNIWATWCPPCREEMPSMERLYRDFADEDFEILAISVDAKVGEIGYDGRMGGNIRKFAEDYGLTFPILHDPSGKIAITYQTTGLPETFLVGRDGVIYKRVSGATTWDAAQHRELIQRVLDDSWP
jgi:cytochrome c biogenesis protein CcmG, thiol:disulfide interchange protein DsbE